MQPDFKNHYYLLRHGESLANIQKIILSHPEEGQLPEFGLSEKGIKQIRNSMVKAQKIGLLGAQTLIYASPFSRCRQTAEAVKRVLGVQAEINYDERLRERWFGDWEKSSDANYQKVWDQDKRDPRHNLNKVENVVAVRDRLFSLIKDLEKRFSGRNILLISHGDPLQILLAAIKDWNKLDHRSVPHLEIGEIRRLE